MSTRANLGSIEQVPAGEGRQFLCAGREVAVFHTREGRVFATEAHCPHRHGPLADGLLGGSRITCPLHEWTFDLASGAPVNGECSIKVFPVSCEPDGTIVLDLSEPAAAISTGAQDVLSRTA